MCGLRETSDTIFFGKFGHLTQPDPRVNPTRVQLCGKASVACAFSDFRPVRHAILLTSEKSSGEGEVRKLQSTHGL